MAGKEDFLINKKKMIPPLTALPLKGIGREQKLPPRMVPHRFPTSEEPIVDLASFILTIDTL